MLEPSFFLAPQTYKITAFIPHPPLSWITRKYLTALRCCPLKDTGYIFQTIQPVAIDGQFFFVTDQPFPHFSYSERPFSHNILDIKCDDQVYDYLCRMDYGFALQYKNACIIIYHLLTQRKTDFKSPAKLLLKILDNILNRTLILWLRQQLGINTLRYPDTYERNKHARYHGKKPIRIENDKKIYNIVEFNLADKDGKLILPPTGMSCHCVATYIQEHNKRPFPDANRVFFKQLNTILSCKNKIDRLAKSDKPFPYLEMAELQNNFEQFILNYLPALQWTRYEVRNPNNPDNKRFLPQTLNIFETVTYAYRIYVLPICLFFCLVASKNEVHNQDQVNPVTKRTRRRGIKQSHAAENHNLPNTDYIKNTKTTSDDTSAIEACQSPSNPLSNTSPPPSFLQHTMQGKLSFASIMAMIMTSNSRRTSHLSPPQTKPRTNSSWKGCKCCGIIPHYLRKARKSPTRHEARGPSIG